MRYPVPDPYASEADRSRYVCADLLELSLSDLMEEKVECEAALRVARKAMSISWWRDRLHKVERHLKGSDSREAGP